VCCRGDHREQRHDAQRRAAGGILRRHRIGVDEEVRVPQWDRLRPDGTVQRARLDLRVDGGPGGPVRYLDHEVSHPTAASYVQDAAQQDGATARRGERVKHRRYGRTVIPMLLETYGRWGPEALRWWRGLAKQVAASDPLLSGRGKWAVAGLLAEWWAETSVALQLANAEAVLASWGESATALGEGDAPEGPGDTLATAPLLPVGR